MFTDCLLSLAAFCEAEDTAICNAIAFGKSGILPIFQYVFHEVKFHPLTFWSRNYFFFKF